MLAESEKYVRATVLGSASRIIKATPIDTGRLVGNWQSNINSPKTSKINRTNESVAQVDAKINVLKLKKTVMGVGGIVVVTFLFCLAILLIVEIKERL